MTTFEKIVVADPKAGLTYYTTKGENTEFLVIHNDHPDNIYQIDPEFKLDEHNILPDSVMIVYKSIILEVIDDYDCVNGNDGSKIQIRINGKPCEQCGVQLIMEVCKLGMEDVADSFIADYVSYNYESNCVSNQLKMVYNTNKATITSEKIDDLTQVWSFKSACATITVTIDETNYNFNTFVVSENLVNLVKILKDYDVEIKLIKAIVAQYPVVGKYSASEI